MFNTIPDNQNPIFSSYSGTLNLAGIWINMKKNDISRNKRKLLKRNFRPHSGGRGRGAEAGVVGPEYNK